MANDHFRFVMVFPVVGFVLYNKCTSEINLFLEVFIKSIESQVVRRRANIIAAHLTSHQDISATPTHVFPMTMLEGFAEAGMNGIPYLIQFTLNVQFMLE
ncbi:hypothetical protein ACS0TY_012096 [Phlomoides rotata]